MDAPPGLRHLLRWAAPQAIQPDTNGDALVVPGVADVGFAVPSGVRRGLRRRRVPPDPITCVVAPDGELAGP